MSPLLDFAQQQTPSVTVFRPAIQTRRSRPIIAATQVRVVISQKVRSFTQLQDGVVEILAGKLVTTYGAGGGEVGGKGAL